DGPPPTITTSNSIASRSISHLLPAVKPNQIFLSDLHCYGSIGYMVPDAATIVVFFAQVNGQEIDGNLHVSEPITPQIADRTACLAGRDGN
ncbi:MAG: hypothetical protein VX017_07730, partial [Pseudomonadota bacterium]|nr:hypothetical protein [Pseudomonadota bacterium]